MTLLEHENVVFVAGFIKTLRRLYVKKHHNIMEIIFFNNMNCRSSQHTFCKEVFLSNFAKLTRTDLKRNRVYESCSPIAWNVTNKDLHHTCFPVNFVNFARTAILGKWARAHCLLRRTSLLKRPGHYNLSSNISDNVS